MTYLTEVRKERKREKIKHLKSMKDLIAAVLVPLWDEQRVSCGNDITESSVRGLEFQNLPLSMPR